MGIASLAADEHALFQTN